MGSPHDRCYRASRDKNKKTALLHVEKFMKSVDRREYIFRRMRGVRLIEGYCSTIMPPPVMSLLRSQVRSYLKVAAS